MQFLFLKKAQKLNSTWKVAYIKSTYIIDKKKKKAGQS